MMLITLLGLCVEGPVEGVLVAAGVEGPAFRAPVDDGPAIDLPFSVT
jgi:hypothetical protein